MKTQMFYSILIFIFLNTIPVYAVLKNFQVNGLNSNIKNIFARLEMLEFIIFSVVVMLIKHARDIHVFWHRGLWQILGLCLSCK